MFLEINGIDVSGLIDKYNYVETQRKIKGPMQGIDLLGNPINDTLGVVYDLSVSVSPCNSSVVKLFADIAALDTVVVRYDSPSRNTIARMEASPSLTSVPLALKSASKTLYYGMTLILEGKNG